METQIEVKPFEGVKDGVKYVILEMSNIQIHSNKMRSSQSIGDKIARSIEAMSPFRIYSPIVKSNSTDEKIKATLLPTDNPSFIKMIEEYQKKGIKVLIRKPKDGIPVLFGRDTEEFLKSKNGQRIIRGLVKNNPVD